MNEKIVSAFWEVLNRGEFNKLSKLMNDEANVYLPNTREVFRGKEKYIHFNKHYPDQWFFTVEKQFACDDVVISCALVTNSEKTISCYVTSFFKFEDGLIVEICEYWGENENPPKWRIDKKISEMY